jgi:hypothetical protein
MFDAGMVFERPAATDERILNEIVMSNDVLMVEPGCRC